MILSVFSLAWLSGSADGISEDSTASISPLTGTSEGFSEETPQVFASGDAPITSFEIGVVDDSTAINGVHYAIENVIFDSSISTLGSISLTFPTEWEFNDVGMNANWAKNTATAGSVSISIATPATNGKKADVKTYLENCYFTLKTLNTFPSDTSSLSIFATEKTQATFIDPEGYVHTYIPVSPGGSVNWFTAYNAAKSYPAPAGYTSKGYLATITSEEEQRVIYDQVAKTTGWLGGMRAVYLDGSMITNPNTVSLGEITFNINQGAKNWYWADGPEAGGIFYDRPSATSPSTGATITYPYTNWFPGEPNAQGGGSFSPIFFK